MTVRLFGLKELPAELRRRKALFLRAARAALGEQGRENGEVCIIFTDGRYIRKINKRYLGHDYVTDVISFHFEPLEYRRATTLGDVYICVPQARRQASQLGHPLVDELVVLVLHGCLHLVGYDDEKPADRRRMFERQDRLAASLLR